MKANQMLDNAFETKKVIPLEKLGELTTDAVKTLDRIFQQYKGGDKEAGQLIMRWVKIGKSLKYG